MSGKGPVFVVGMNGSGTTMLLDHLDSHPELYGFPLETKILPDYLGGTRAETSLQNDDAFRALFDEMAKSYTFLVENDGRPVPLPPSWQKLPRTPAGIFDYIMTYFAGHEAKSRWCEKSPLHVQYISLLSTSFPDAKFIHVIRDGRDCAASFHRRWSYTPRSTIYRWKRSVIDGRAQGNALPQGRYLEVFYERLTFDPQQQLQEVCRFLEIDFTESMLQAKRDTKRVQGLAELEIVSNSGKFRSYFSARDLDGLEKIAGSTLASLGYPTDRQTASYDPPIVLRHLWRLSDRTRFAAELTVNKMRSPEPFPWRLMAARFRRAFRQFFLERF